MMTITRQKLKSIGVTALVFALIACIPFGLFMSWYMDNSDWLVFCAPLLMFWS
jgi:hypothetical protein